MSKPGGKKPAVTGLIDSRIISSAQKEKRSGALEAPLRAIRLQLPPLIVDASEEIQEPTPGLYAARAQPVGA